MQAIDAAYPDRRDVAAIDVAAVMLQHTAANSAGCCNGRQEAAASPCVANRGISPSRRNLCGFSAHVFGWSGGPRSVVAVFHPCCPSGGPRSVVAVCPVL